MEHQLLFGKYKTSPRSREMPATSTSNRAGITAGLQRERDKNHIGNPDKYCIKVKRKAKNSCAHESRLPTEVHKKNYVLLLPSKNSTSRKLDLRGVSARKATFAGARSCFTFRSTVCGRAETSLLFYFSDR